MSLPRDAVPRETLPAVSRGLNAGSAAEAIDRLLAEALPQDTLYAVGGRVRDELRASFEGISPSPGDLDYVVTGLAFDDLAERLAPIGRVDVVGASFSVLKVTIDGATVDVALPRREESTGSGHRAFRVRSGPEVPLRDDLGRRDFRMNMIARAVPSGELIDPFDGEADIRRHRIDILTPRTFHEDPLRMLRAAGFAARFNYALSELARTSMQDAAALITTVSRERIADELSKLLVLAPRPSTGFEILRECGILRHIWPEILEGVGVEQNEWHAYDVWHHAMATLDASPTHDLAARLAALLHDVGKPRTKSGPHFYRHEIVGSEMAREMLTRLRFSNGVVESVTHLVRQHMYAADPEMRDPALRRFIRRVGEPNLAPQFSLRQADILGSGLPRRDDSNARFEERVWAEVARKPPFSVAELKVGGDDVIAAMRRYDLVAAGFRGDRRVGDILHALFEEVTDEPARNDRETLLALLDEYLRDGGSTQG